MKTIFSLVLLLLSGIVASQIYTSEIEVTNATNGKVGIGLLNPTSSFEIGLNSDTDNFRIRRYSLGGRSQIVLADENSIELWRFGLTGGGVNDFNFYNGTQNILSLQSNNNIILVPSSGFVGIGTTSPTSPLYIKQTSGDALQFERSGHDNYEIGLKGSKGLYITNITDSRQELVFKGDGNIGIDTQSPTERLDVNGSIRIPNASSTNNASHGIVAASNDDFLYDSHYINHYGFGFHNYQDPSSSYDAKNAYISGYFGVDIFTGGQSRLRVNRNGTVSIGAITTSYALDVNGTARVTSLIQTSDERLKRDIRPMSGSNQLQQLSVYQYKLLQPAPQNSNFSIEDTAQANPSRLNEQVYSKDHIGLMAQEVEQYFPDLVYTDEQGYKAIDYSQFIPILIESYKAQQSQIDALLQRLSSLENEIDLLKNK